MIKFRVFWVPRQPSAAVFASPKALSQICQSPQGSLAEVIFPIHYVRRHDFFLSCLCSRATTTACNIFCVSYSDGPSTTERRCLRTTRLYFNFSQGSLAVYIPIVSYKVKFSSSQVSTSYSTVPRQPSDGVCEPVCIISNSSKPPRTIGRLYSGLLHHARHEFFLSCLCSTTRPWAFNIFRVHSIVPRQRRSADVRESHTSFIESNLSKPGPRITIGKLYSHYFFLSCFSTNTKFQHLLSANYSPSTTKRPCSRTTSLFQICQSPRIIGRLYIRFLPQLLLHQYQASSSAYSIAPQQPIDGVRARNPAQPWFPHRRPRARLWTGPGQSAYARSCPGWRGAPTGWAQPARSNMI